MKTTRLFIGVLAIGAIMTSCAGGNDSSQAEGEQATTEQAATENNATTEAVTWNVDPTNSNIRWEGGTSGAKVYSHFGDLKIKDGTVTTNGGEVASASITVDMTTIEPKDENYGEDSPPEKLVGHLSTGDFFDVENHPTATFELLRVEGAEAVGNLTIRGNTHEERFQLNNVDINGDMMKAEGVLEFDRQKYDVAWEHFMKDVILADMINLQIYLVAKKS